MDHPEAIRLMAVEKYLLNELAPEIRRSFEEHFFECPQCEFDIQSGYALIDGSKEVFSFSAAAEPVKDIVKPRSRFFWLRPAFTVPVMAALVFAAIYPNVVTVPQLKGALAAAQAPQIFTPVYLTAGASRGAVPVVTTKRNYPAALTFDIPAESRFTSYVCELQSPSGELEGLLPVSAEAARNAISVSMYPKHGNSGVYQLVVFGVSQNAGTQKVEIERQSFELQIQN